MTGNYQRTPIGESLNRIARDASGTALQQTAKALPCTVVAVNGQLVTVKFETNAGPFTLPNITIPINTSQYDWLPIQVGDPGYTQPADIALAHISGVSDSVPNLVQSGNLTGLAFQPVAKKQYTAANANQRVVQGPGGVRIQTLNGSCIVEVTSSGVTITIGTQVVSVTSTGVAITGNLTVTGGITAGFGGGDSVTLQHHIHGGGPVPTPGT